MATFRDVVIVALLRRMGGAQYLERDELKDIECPHFSNEGEYLVVRRANDEEQLSDLRAVSDENGSGSEMGAPP
jgi:hypothetical protein